MISTAWMVALFGLLAILISIGILWSTRSTQKAIQTLVPTYENIEMIEGTLSELPAPLTLEEYKSLMPDPSDTEALKKQLESLISKVSIQSDSAEKASKALIKEIKGTPAKTLSTIQGSVNNTAGKMGEMMQLIELQQTYDRLIVVGDIVDFIGIKFPTEGNSGSIDFIDIKTGRSASLSSDQRKLRDLVASEDGQITFKVVKVQIT